MEAVQKRTRNFSHANAPRVRDDAQVLARVGEIAAAVYAAEAATEIQQSKAVLEQRLGTEVISFAYPYGSLNEPVKQLVAEAGFTFGVATDTGGLHIEDDRMQVFRISIFPHETSGSLFKKTAPWYRRYYRWKRKK